MLDENIRQISNYLKTKESIGKSCALLLERLFDDTCYLSTRISSIKKNNYLDFINKVFIENNKLVIETIESSAFIPEGILLSSQIKRFLGLSILLEELLPFTKDDKENEVMMALYTLIDTNITPKLESLSNKILKNKPLEEDEINYIKEMYFFGKELENLFEEVSMESIVVPAGVDMPKETEQSNSNYKFDNSSIWQLNKNEKEE